MLFSLYWIKGSYTIHLHTEALPPLTTLHLSHYTIISTKKKNQRFKERTDQECSAKTDILKIYWRFF